MLGQQPTPEELKEMVEEIDVDGYCLPDTVATHAYTLDPDRSTLKSFSS